MGSHVGMRFSRKHNQASFMDDYYGRFTLFVYNYVNYRILVMLLHEERTGKRLVFKSFNKNVLIMGFIILIHNTVLLLLLMHGIDIRCSSSLLM